MAFDKVLFCSLCIVIGFSSGLRLGDGGFTFLNMTAEPQNTIRSNHGPSLTLEGIVVPLGNQGMAFQPSGGMTINSARNSGVNPLSSARQGSPGIPASFNGAEIVPTSLGTSGFPTSNFEKLLKSVISRNTAQHSPMQMFDDVMSLISTLRSSGAGSGTMQANSGYSFNPSEGPVVSAVNRNVQLGGLEPLLSRRTGTGTNTLGQSDMLLRDFGSSVLEGNGIGQPGVLTPDLGIQSLDNLGQSNVLTRLQTVGQSPLDAPQAGNSLSLQAGRRLQESSALIPDLFQLPTSQQPVFGALKNVFTRSRPTSRSFRQIVIRRSAPMRREGSFSRGEAEGYGDMGSERGETFRFGGQQHFFTIVRQQPPQRKVSLRNIPGLRPRHLGLTAKHIRSLLNGHNKARRELRAADMHLMRWNGQLAVEALRWAKNCVFDHQHGGRGENLAMVSGSIASTNLLIEYGINGWYNEKNMWRFGDGFSSATGHYTQMIWSSSKYMGCAAHRCPDMYFLVCFYAPPGNIQGMNPYTRGRRCSRCPSRCRNGLCL